MPPFCLLSHFFHLTRLAPRPGGIRSEEAVGPLEQEVSSRLGRTDPARRAVPSGFFATSSPILINLALFFHLRSRCLAFLLAESSTLVPSAQARDNASVCLSFKGASARNAGARPFRTGETRRLPLRVSGDKGSATPVYQCVPPQLSACGLLRGTDPTSTAAASWSPYGQMATARWSRGCRRRHRRLRHLYRDYAEPCIAMLEKPQRPIASMSLLISHRADGGGGSLSSSMAVLKSRRSAPVWIRWEGASDRRDRPRLTRLTRQRAPQEFGCVSSATIFAHGRYPGVLGDAGKVAASGSALRSRR